MDINEKLDQIIFKYHLDRYYPHYRNMYEAKKILGCIVSEIINKDESVLFVGDNEAGLNFVKSIVRDYDNAYFLFYNCKDLSFRQLETVDCSAYEHIYLISYYNAAFIERWLKLHNIQYEWIYDIFEKHGIVMQNEFFAFGKTDLLPLIPNYRRHNNKWAETIQCELYCQQSRFENAEDSQIKRIALEKCLFLSLYIRNFIVAHQYIELLSNEDKRYEQLWKEVTDLLSEIKDIIEKKQQEDIFLFWIDALAYGDEKCMPYLQNIGEKSVFFENAISHTGYTHSEIRSLFLSKKEIDDRAYRILKITRENSPVIQMLEEQGYDIKVSSGCFNDSFPFQYLSEQFFPDLYTPGSMTLWDMLSNRVTEKKKTFYVVHIMDTHDPYLGGKWCEDIYRMTYAWKESQYKMVREELDKLLAFYDMFRNEKAYYIYMSDHGKDPAPNRFHEFFSIYHKDLQPRKITGIYSTLDFHIVLKQIIMEGAIKEQEFIREYAEIIRVDWYNFEGVKNVIKGVTALTTFHFGAKGIVDRDYIYFHYNTGKEWLQKRGSLPLYNPMLFYDCEDDICDTALLPHYRELAGTYPEDMLEDDKFKYSKYIHILYDNLLKRNNMNERIRMINLLLNRYPDNSIAIRMGGEHSMLLYYTLSEENKRKVWGFIDGSNTCSCSRLHLPIISPGTCELETVGIKAVLLSSYKSLNLLREESRTYPGNIDVLDIYDYFDKNGVECRKAFYEVIGTKEDYNVGFPFD